MRDQFLCKRTPGLVVQVVVQRRREYVRAGQYLHRDEQHVGEQEQRERSNVGLSRALLIKNRQGTGAAQQISQSAPKSSIQTGECLDRLMQQAPQSKFVRMRLSLTAGGAIRRGQPECRRRGRSIARCRSCCCACLHKTIAPVGAARRHAFPAQRECFKWHAGQLTWPQATRRQYQAGLPHRHEPRRLTVWSHSCGEVTAKLPTFLGPRGIWR